MFVHNLARGMAAVEEVADVVLVVHAGDESLVAETVAAGDGRFATASLHPLPRLQRWRQRWHRSRHRRLCDRIASGVHAEKVLARRRRHEAMIQQIFAGQRLDLSPNFGDRDVWLLPHVDVRRPFAEPSVVVVHDMVPLHFSDVMEKRKVESFRRNCQQVVRQATLVGTMSRTIRDVDIVGLLGCPQNKVRVVPGAVPTDFGEPVGTDELLRRHPVAGQPYLLYPAGYRSYKNHVTLVEALALLHQAGHPELQLVLTGFEGLPETLAGQLQAVGVMEHVHLLGVVDRPTLAGLYQHAAMTVVPSLYEQGSYPVVEAIHWGSPAACSDIPALREYLEKLQGAVPFFDAREPRRVVDVVAAVLADRASVLARQQAALTQMATRSWQTVAEEWITVLREAVQGNPAKRGR